MRFWLGPPLPVAQSAERYPLASTQCCYCRRCGRARPPIAFPTPTATVMLPFQGPLPSGSWFWQGTSQGYFRLPSGSLSVLMTGNLPR
jgi:hypothetical protein